MKYKAFTEIEELRKCLDDTKLRLEDVDLYIRHLKDCTINANGKLRKIHNLVDGLYINRITQERCCDILQEIKDILEGKD